MLYKLLGYSVLSALILYGFILSCCIGIALYTRAEYSLKERKNKRQSMAPDNTQ